MGRGSTGTTCDYAPVQRHHLTEHMSGAQQGTATAGYPGPHQAAPYGRGHQQGHVDMSAPGSSAQHAPEEAMYTRSGAPAGPAHHLPTVAEEDVLAPPVGSLELVTEQEADLGELAAAAAAALRGGPALEVPPEPTRVLLVRNVAAEVVDTELQDIFQAFGDLQGLHTASKQLGFVMVAYYDLRAAISAQSTLHGTLINKIAIDVQFSPITQRGKAVNQGQVVVFNLDPDSSNDQLVWLFSKFGDVQGIKQSPQRPNQKFITFYDTRHAAAAMRAMNRAEQLNKIPSYVTPQQIASLHSVTSGPNLLQLPQLQGLDAGGAASGSGASGQPGPSGSAAWEGLSNHTTVEGLLQLVQNQQGHAAMAAAGMMSAGGSQDPSAAFNRLALDPLAANPRSLPLSDSASSIAGVPHNLLMAAGSQAGGKSHLPAMPGGGRGVQGMSGMDNSQAAAAAMYNAAAAAAADRQAVAAQQHLQLLQASEAANMLMGLNLGMDPVRQQAAAAALWEQQAGKLAGMQDAAAAAAGLWPAAASSNLLGGAANMNISQLAALQELQLRQQQVAAAQQVQALQQAATAASMNPLNAAANLQAAAQILQAAGLGQLGPAASFLPNPAASAPYNASAAAQILQQAGLGLPGLGLPLPMGSGSMLGGHGGSGRGVGEGSGNNRGGGRLSRRTTDPVAEAERKAQQEKLYALDLDKISRGEDKRTTLMIKNIPNKYTQKMLLATVDEFFRGTYDFFYLPIDFKNKCNVGYAFINMVQPIHIIPLVQRFNHKKWERFNSEKVCNISYARIQGRAALVQHFQHSSLMHEDKRCRPILFTLDDTGELAGEQEPFPASTSNPGSMGGSERLGHSMGSGARLSGLAGSSNSLRSQGGSSSSLRDLHHKHLAAQAAHLPPHH